MFRREHLSFLSPKGEVSCELLVPQDISHLYVFGHGAGAGMRHRDMEAISISLAEVGIGTLRYNFPYKENGNGPPDPKAVLLGTVRAAVQEANNLMPSVPLIAGGKSMGGRMTSLAQAESALPNVKGLLFYGFPLHPSAKPSLDRASHLALVEIPMLLLQGTRDSLAELDLLRPLAENLPTAELHLIEGADHSFHVLKSSGRTDAEVILELAATVRLWADALSL